MKEVKFNELVNKTIFDISINRENDEIVFSCTDDTMYLMYHETDCCETVTIEDICGDIQDLINSPVIQAFETTNSDNPKHKEYEDSFLWTFYTITTIKGTVTLRWYGESNGYYSESVSFMKIQ